MGKNFLLCTSERQKHLKTGPFGVWFANGKSILVHFTYKNNLLNKELAMIQIVGPQIEQDPFLVPAT
jgi:hypothetical protein